MQKDVLIGCGCAALAVAFVVAAPTVAYLWARGRAPAPDERTPPAATLPADATTARAPVTTSAAAAVDLSRIGAPDLARVDLVALVPAVEAFARNFDAEGRLVGAQAAELHHGTLDLTGSASATYDFVSRPHQGARRAFSVIAQRGRLRADLVSAPQRNAYDDEPFAQPICASRDAWAAVVRAGALEAEPASVVLRSNWGVDTTRISTVVWEWRAKPDEGIAWIVTANTCAILATPGDKLGRRPLNPR